MATLIPADKGTHAILCGLITLGALPLGWPLAAVPCVVVAVLREVYGWRKRARTMTRDDWREAGLDIAAVYAEAKALGFDTKAMRRAIALRKQDKATRAEADMVLDLYLQALGEI